MTSMTSSGAWLLMMGLAIVAFGGCATRANVSGQSAIATARYAIRDAENQTADQYSAVKLESAREKLEAAQKASKAAKPGEAMRLADEATVDAKLAAALARKAQAEAALIEANRVRRENEALRSEALDATAGD